MPEPDTPINTSTLTLDISVPQHLSDLNLKRIAEFPASKVWAHRADEAQDILEQGDVEEVLNAASAIGDDRLQQQSRGYVTPDSFTHGSSAQRVRWFQQGLQTGDPDQCNTFETQRL